MNFERLKSARLFALLVAGPMFLASIYYGFFALDRYVSVSQVAVRQVGGSESPQLPGLAVMLGAVNPTSREETLYLREFILSADMVNKLEQNLHWSEHYADHRRDPLYFLSKSASREDLLLFYKRVVSAHFDEQTGLLTVSVQAFNASFAEQILSMILVESERFVNELSHRMAREQMTFARGELADARKNYEKSRDEILTFQGANSSLDAEVAAKARAEVIQSIEALLIQERTALTSMKSVLGANAPQIRQQDNRIKALERQLNIESGRLVSEKGGEKLNVLASRYRDLVIDATIAEETYKFAVGAVESARIEASKKLRSLVTIVTPNPPDSAVYPERIYNLITLLIALVMFYGIARFLIATIEDHRD